MPEQPLTISPILPTEPSMNFQILRQQGIEEIQKLSSLIWTDYNLSDPGITILEYIAYGITDLGFRTSFDIKDLLASVPGADPSFANEFFTAAQILVNRPVTLNDYRKILIDHPQIRRAWIQPATGCEQSFYYIPGGKDEEAKLSYTSQGDLVKVKGLYTVILEFEEDKLLGDLNSNILPWVVPFPSDPSFTSFEIEVDFPRWNEAPVSFRDPAYAIPSAENIGLKNLLKTGSNRYSAEVIITNTDPEKIIRFSVNIYITSFVPRNISASDILDAIVSEFEKNDTQGLLITYARKIAETYAIIADIRKEMMNYRNLSEDFFEFKSMEVEEVSVCTEIELTVEADPEEVQARILFALEKIISPRVKFKTLKELLEEGKKPDEIFEGPLLKHGFIDNQELKKISQFPTFYVSEFIDAIMDIEGVVNVRNINFSTYIDNVIQISGDTNCFSGTFPETHRPRISPKKSKIFFFKNDNPHDKAKGLFVANQREVFELLAELRMLEEDPKISDDERDLPVPMGTSKDVEEYFSIQSDFPLTYGIGDIRLPDDSTALRKAQVKQLKAYLLFFEQQMANFLSQLAHLRTLFSFQDDAGRTYFTNPVYRVPYVANLIKAFTDTLPPGTNLDDFSVLEPLFLKFIENAQTVSLIAVDQGQKIFTVGGDITTEIDVLKKIVISDAGDNDGEYTIQTVTLNGGNTDIKVEEAIPDTTLGDLTYIQKGDNLYAASLKEMTESEDQYIGRRNRFLNHLLARFSEKFVDFSVTQLQKFGPDAMKDVISGKSDMLKIYPEISSNRGGAFNYKKEKPPGVPDVWDTDNVSGYEKRVCRILGIKDFDRRHLYFDINERLDDLSSAFVFTGSGPYNFDLIDGVEILLSGIPAGYATEAERLDVVSDLITYGFNKCNYYLTDDGVNFTFEIKIAYNGEHDHHLPPLPSVNIQYPSFSSKEERAAFIDRVSIYLYDKFWGNEEGMHLIEHLLLRPKTNGDYFVETTASTLVNSATGAISFTQTEPISALNSAAKKITIANKDLTSDIIGGDRIKLFDSDHAVNDGEYNVVSVALAGADTEITLAESIPDDTVGGKGSIFFPLARIAPIASVDQEDKTFTIVSQDLTPFLASGDKVEVKGSKNAANDEVYIIDTVSLDAGNTLVKVKEAIASAELPHGSLYYFRPSNHLITFTDPAQKLIRIGGQDLSYLNAGTVIEIKRSAGAANDGVYKILSASFTGGNTDIVIESKKVLVQDAFLPVSKGGGKMPDGCICPPLTDPYNFRLTLILPSWTRRARSKEFRGFAEAVLREEAPAHLYANIIWLGTYQMRDFENVFKPWLEENAKEEPDPVALRDKLAALIAQLNKLQNEYVPAELHDIHDPNDSGSLIVLDKTALGTL